MSFVENVARQNRERKIAPALAILNGHSSSSSRTCLCWKCLPRRPRKLERRLVLLRASARDRPGQHVPNGRPRSFDLQRSESVPISRVNAASMASSNKLRSVPSSEVKGTPTRVPSVVTAPTQVRRHSLRRFHYVQPCVTRATHPLHTPWQSQRLRSLPGTQQRCLRI
ncbi:hypothetical protein EDD15DRAFT_131613 [Pisolithus albus]|nr:hypothetical protein EDD15DRAFT_131613 [Pisolithus albus]